MFVAIDGPDGAGKSTVSLRLTGLINEESGYERAIYTSEPTQGRYGREIRRLLGSADASVSLTELFLQDRAEHVKEIESWLSAGLVVICDRYKYSTVVYQHLQGEDAAELALKNEVFLKPDIAVILNAARVETLLGHITARGAGREIFETRPIIEAASGLYGRMREFFPEDEIIFVDAEQELDKTVKEIYGIMIEHGLKTG